LQLEFKAEKAAAVARNKANLEREKALRLKKTDDDQDEVRDKKEEKIEVAPKSKPLEYE
jgi:hypothetical protein